MAKRSLQPARRRRHKNHGSNIGLLTSPVTDEKPLAHLVALVTGYHWLLGLKRDLQHLLPGAKQAFPQQPPPSPWHGKVLPFTFTQQVSPRATHTSPQQLSPPAHVKLSPLRLRQ